MPIYAYRCGTCGHAQDVLQKMSDPVLSVCPACGESTYAKQLTAAGFQLKGSGWYVTDFRNGNTGPAAKPDAEGKDAAAKPAEAPTPGAPAEVAAPDKASDKPLNKNGDKPAAKPAEKAAASPPPPPPPAPAAGS